MKMGYIESNSIMESRAGSSSLGLGRSCRAKKQTTSFCPKSSSKVTQSIIKNHMVSHYKRIYSAKAVIDTSVPKSLLQSVKYNDQIKKEHLKKSVRPNSALSFSRRNDRTSCFSAQSSLSVQDDDSAYLCSRSSMLSSPKFTTSFNAQDIVYPSFNVSSHRCRPSSEIKYHRPEIGRQRKASSCSLVNLRDLDYKTFTDPAQKTYSGDLLQKHSQHFTQEKPFTPRTLKSDKTSYLSKYRYYRTPQRKPKDGSQSRLMEQNHTGSRKDPDSTEKSHKLSQEYATEHGLSEDEDSSTYLSSLGPESHKTKSKNCYFIGSSSRVSPKGCKSSFARHVFPEEEELMYLEFISAVTDDILSRGHISNSMIDRVMKRHIDMNIHQLDEGKMRHLLEILREEFEEPFNTSSSFTDPKENYSFEGFFPHLESGWKLNKTEEHMPVAVSLNNNNMPILDDDQSFTATELNPVVNSNAKEREETNFDGKDAGSALQSESGSQNAENREEDLNLIESAASTGYDENSETSSLNGGDVKENGSLELESKLSQVLYVSDNPDAENLPPENNNELIIQRALSVSDDEF